MVCYVVLFLLSTGTYRGRCNPQMIENVETCFKLENTHILHRRLGSGARLRSNINRNMWFLLFSPCGFRRERFCFNFLYKNLKPLWFRLSFLLWKMMFLVNIKAYILFITTFCKVILILRINQ